MDFLKKQPFSCQLDICVDIMGPGKRTHVKVASSKESSASSINDYFWTNPDR